LRHELQNGVQPHTLGVPPPPQVLNPVQLFGQVPPQPSGPPHTPAQLVVQPHTLAVPPPPQVCGATQLLGQVLPHPSAPPHLPAQLGVHVQLLPMQLYCGPNIP
jgi:hypothetical protein